MNLTPEQEIRLASIKLGISEKEAHFVITGTRHTVPAPETKPTMTQVPTSSRFGPGGETKGKDPAPAPAPKRKAREGTERNANGLYYPANIEAREGDVTKIALVSHWFKTEPFISREQIAVRLKFKSTSAVRRLLELLACQPDFVKPAKRTRIVAITPEMVMDVKTSGEDAVKCGARLGISMTAVAHIRQGFYDKLLAKPTA